MPLIANKKRNAKDNGGECCSIGAITDDGDAQATQRTPPKNAKLDGDGSAGGEQQQQGTTPSPSRLHYQMNALEAALCNYFSPKKRSPGRSPGRPTQRKLKFSSSDSECEEQRENVKPNSHPKDSTNRCCDFAAVKRCFEVSDSHLPLHLKNRPSGQTLGEHFGQWLHLLQSGQFSILLHGLGSKRGILSQFRDFLSSRGHQSLFADGLNPSDTVPKIIDRMAEELQIKGTPKAKQKTAEAAAITLRNSVDVQLVRPIVLIVLNMDSAQLRSRDHQRALSELAKSSKVQLIASVDHINAALIWDESLRDAFAWLHYPISTFCCYWDEALADGIGLLGLDEKGSAKHTLSSLDVFWGAATSNMRKILTQLALHAPAKKDRDRMDALTIPKFCLILKEDFATTSETVLRQQLIEFCDHRLVQLDKDGTIQLLVDRQLLSSFLDSKFGSE